MTQYWTGSLYCGIILNWNCAARILNVSILVFVTDALNIFQHSTPSILHHSPHQWSTTKYGSISPQMSQQPDDSPSIAPAVSNIFHQVVGTLFYYYHAVQPTIMVTLDTITSEQVNITQAMSKNMSQLLNYAATRQRQTRNIIPAAWSYTFAVILPSY